MPQPQMPPVSNWRFEVDFERIGWLTIDTPGVPGLDLPGIDFVSLAKGYGVAAERVSAATDLAAALSRGMSAGAPHLVEVEIDPTVPPLI